MLSFFLGVPDPDLGMMRLVIIVGSVYGIIFGFLNSLHPLLPPPPLAANDDKANKAPDNVPPVDVRYLLREGGMIANRKAATLAKKQRPW